VSRVGQSIKADVVVGAERSEPTSRSAATSYTAFTRPKERTSSLPSSTSSAKYKRFVFGASVFVHPCSESITVLVFFAANDHFGQQSVVGSFQSYHYC